MSRHWPASASLSENTQILLASRPTGEPALANFRIVQAEVPRPERGDVLLRTLYLSLDPYMRARMNASGSYAAPVEVGAVMTGGTVAEVVESRHPNFAAGEVVLAHTGWQTFGVQAGAELRKLNSAIAPYSTALGVLGMPGFTAYAGLREIGRPAAGETVVVAAASGPVGSTVGQLARMAGARVVGIVGGPAKAEYISELGFDEAVDHRAPDFGQRLERATPDGIDVYFENVGGRVWDHVLPRLNTYARVPVCGLVSTYNGAGPVDGSSSAAALMAAILRKSITLRGFIQTEFIHAHHARFLEEASAWVRAGTLKYREDVVDGLENAPGCLPGNAPGRELRKADHPRLSADALGLEEIGRTNRMLPSPESGPVRASERYPDDSQLDRTIAVVGGTGPRGRGLAYRFALAGDRVA
jgi:NADPH-dependent curcumin reductase CurA